MSISDQLQLFFKIFSRALMLLLVLPLTNSAKGLVAKKLGDDSAEREGRITLNPMAHLDLLGSLAIMLCGFGWSKPMPINPTRMKNYKKGVILISLTGPVTHFLSAIVCMNISGIITNTLTLRSNGGLAVQCVAFLFSLLAQINICLGVINLLPIPPMDGFNILHQFAGAKFNQWYFYNYRMINQVSFIIIIVLFFIGDATNGLIDPLGWIIQFFSWLLSFTTFWIPLVFH